MRLWTREHLKSENGNALLMALSVIMVLTAFGTASLMTSVANIHMSSSYRNWSQQYYILDVNAEDKVNQLNILLQSAEKDAQDYMAGQYYIYPDPTNIPPVNLRISLTAQTYINTQWGNVAPHMQDLNNPDYQAKLQTFQNDTFQRLYYYYASQRLYQSSGYTSVTYLNDPSVSLGNYQDDLFSQGTQALADGSLIVNINSANDITTTNTINGINPNTVNKNDSNFVNGKSVAVKVDVQFPTYTTLTQTQQIPIQGNPIWANAITSAGNIGFVGSGTSTIKGDIFSADNSEPLPINDNTVTNNGIFSQGADVEIYGNVYSKGNLHIIGSNSTIGVHNYPNDMVVDMKNNIFANNNLYFDLAALEAQNLAQNPDPNPRMTLTDYIQGSIPSGKTYIPMVYQDSNGGNVYCNSLAVEGSYANQAVAVGNINVAGNVTTYNDIRMDGLNSKITVSQNNIGINSTASSTGDPNASSAVINNTALPQPGSAAGSTITLAGNFIVPGTAFASYNAVKKPGDSLFSWNPNSYSYYQTGESITASSPDIFSAYMTPVISPNNTDYNYYYDQYTNDPKPTPDNVTTESNLSAYYLMRADAQGSPGSDILEPKIKQLVDFLHQPGKVVVTNIFSGSSVNGYALGGALLQKPGTSTATVYDPIVSDPNSNYTDYVNNQNAFAIFKNWLANIFQDKTQQLGTATKSASSFDGVFVNKSAIISNGTLVTGGVNISPTVTPSFVYLQQSLTNPNSNSLNLPAGTVYSGIIYCEGNLNITGSGTFNGAIICEGNVTVSGTPTISYAETAIMATLMSSSNIRNFFAPGAMGGVNYSPHPPTTTSYDGAVRQNAVRYKILEWKEQQQ